MTADVFFILTLTLAREALFAEAGLTMPPGAKEQRADMVAAVERRIAEMLHRHPEGLAEDPGAEAGDLQDDNTPHRRAWSYLKEVWHLPPPPPSNLSAYGHLKEAFSEHGNLSLAASLLEWMLRTKMLAGLPAQRIMDAKSVIEVCMHRVLNRSEMAAWLEQSTAEEPALSEGDKRNLALIRHQLREAQGLDEALVAALSEACSAGQHVWEEAKPRGDFAAWLPSLERVVALVRQKGEALGNLFGVAPYQALLGGTEHNPGLQNETVIRLFKELRRELPPLIQQVRARQAKEAPPVPLPDVPVEDQQRVARMVMQALGLDEHYSRLDISAHPFSTGEWDDVRITTRYREDNMLPALMGVIHETGHALYSRALPREWKGQPVGMAQSMWVHESQSLFWENQIAGSPEFMEFLAPLIRKELNVDGPAWTAENFYKLVTRVQLGFIRVDADEVTYPAHVILRHDIEQRLIDGSLASEDLPAAWNRAMKELLGLDVPNDTLGCMQDVHWPSGSFGYFPAYTFGAVGAAQLMQAMRRDLPTLSDDITHGRFTSIREWLGEHIHSKGAYYDGETLFKNVTGEALSAAPFFEHLKSRYLSN